MPQCGPSGDAPRLPSRTLSQGSGSLPRARDHHGPRSRDLGSFAQQQLSKASNGLEANVGRSLKMQVRDRSDPIPTHGGGEAWKQTFVMIARLFFGLDDQASAAAAEKEMNQYKNKTMSCMYATLLEDNGGAGPNIYIYIYINSLDLLL